MTNETIQKIIKDYKFPIPAIPEYYDYFFNLYEPLLKTRTIRNLLEDEISRSNLSEGDYMEKLYQTPTQIIKTITESDAFKEFSDSKNPMFVGKDALFSQKPCSYTFSKKTDVYQAVNVGKKFMSIDLEKANFQVCRKYSPSLLLGCNSYEELIKKFMNSEYLVKTKAKRQYIFGELCPQRQHAMECFYTGKILDFLIKKGYFEEKDFRIYTHDELVFNVTEYKGEDYEQKIFDDIFEEFGLRTHVESYTIKEIFNNSYVKVFQNGKVAFKNVPNTYFAQAYKKYFGGKIEKQDLAFVYEGQVAYFKHPL